MVSPFDVRIGPPPQKNEDLPTALEVACSSKVQWISAIFYFQDETSSLVYSKSCIEEIFASCLQIYYFDLYLYLVNSYVINILYLVEPY